MSEQKLSGKVAVVTGAASGIGRGLVELFHANGALVVGLDLKPLPAEMAALCVAVQGDVTVEADVQRLIDTAVSEYGRVDIMANVAGGARSAPILDMPFDDFDFTIKLCLYSVLYGIKHAGRQMRKQGTGGAIITISSHSSMVPEEWMSPYCTAKAGVNQLIKVAALELAPFGITVNGIAPGLIDTPIIEAYTKNPDCRAEMFRRTPLGRFGTVADVANYALFLVSGDASYITGTIQLIDGGQLLEIYPNLMDISMKSVGIPFPYPESVKAL